MKRIVFFNVSAAGHVIPTFGLVAELVNRGQEVIYFEAPPFQAELEAFGASFRSYPSIRPYEGSFAGLPFHNELDLAPVLTWCALEWLPSLLEQVAKEKPDYIIHDSLSLWGKLVAHLLNIPAVCVIATAALNAENTLEQPNYLSDAPGLDLETLPSLTYFNELEQELREKYATPPITFMDTFTNRQDLNICYLPRELQPGVEKFDSSFHFVGPCDPVRATVKHDFDFDLLTDDPLIFISFGSIHDPGIDVFRHCIQAFKDERVQVLMLLSPNMERDVLGEFPDNFLIRNTGTVPQLEILERTDLFIMHGAGGAARESAWRSVPMVAIPQTFEQDMISRRIEALGAGVRLPQSEVTSHSLRETATRILSETSYRDQSCRLGEACRNAGGAKLAVDEIFRYVKSVLPTRGSATHLLPPGPGSSEALNVFRVDHKDLLNALRACAFQYGDVVHLPLEDNPAVLLNDPLDIAGVINDHENFAKFSNDGPVLHLIGDSLQTRSGKAAMERRKLLSPIFKPKSIAELTGFMIAATTERLEAWHSGESLDLGAEMNDFALKVAIRYHFGDINQEHQTQIATQFSTASQFLTDVTLERIPASPEGPRVSLNQFEETTSTLRAFMLEHVRLRRSSEQCGVDLTSRIMAIRKESGELFSDEEVVNEVLAMMLAGHRTISLALVGLFECLLYHPMVQDRLLNELDEVVQGGNPSLMDLEKLSLAGKVINESLRLFPPAGMMSRRCVKETVIQGWTIPKGTVALFSQWIVHRDHRIYEEALKFCPDRWTPSFEESLPRFAYFPFGGGARACIGRGISLIELKVILALVIRKFRIELPVGEWNQTFQVETINAERVSGFRPVSRNVKNTWI
jgi:MGT family glycosyltransferase